MWSLNEVIKDSFTSIVLQRNCLLNISETSSTPSTHRWMLYIVSDSDVCRTWRIVSHNVFLFHAALPWMFEHSLDNEDASFPEKTKVTRTRFPSLHMGEKKYVTQMAMPNPSQVPCAPRPNKDIPCSGNTALCCVVLKCLRQANTINTAEQCHASTLTIYLLKTSTSFTRVTIKCLTNAPQFFSASKKSWLWHL